MSIDIKYRHKLQDRLAFSSRRGIFHGADARRVTLPFPLPLSAQIGYVQRNKTFPLPGLLIDAGLCRSKEPLKTVHFA